MPIWVTMRRLIPVWARPNDDNALLFSTSLTRPAERFAKTLRGKLQRNYHELDHVKGQPFALALADFHVSGSMV